MKGYISCSVIAILILALSGNLFAQERADIIVAQDGSGDFTTIQEAINSVPLNNSELKIILIKNGVYNEKIRIDADFIALVGEDRDSTRIEYFEPYVWDSVYVDIGRAVINIYADDITLANLTAENTQPEVDIHAFTVYGTGNTRTIIINCNILSNGGDTVSLWNGESGMYYHNTCYLKGAVDFLCPRGWCYAENIDFYCTRTTTPLWHDGSKDEDQKFVVKNATFDGTTTFNLGRNHYDGAFYLLNHTYSEKMADVPFFRPESSTEPYKWGRRYYFHNCIRPAGNYDWHKNNLITAKGSPMPEEISPAWTFGGEWDPVTTLPSVLPFAFLPKPDNNQIHVVLEPELTWVPGRNAESHNIYFGKSNPPDFVGNVTENSFIPGTLQPNTIYYWRVDEVTANGIIEGSIWQFRTESDQLPKKATHPFPADQAVDVEFPIERLLWKADSLETKLHQLYFGTQPDSMELVSTYSVPGYYLDPLIIGQTYYWRVDLVNKAGITQGERWSFTMAKSPYTKADYLQDSGNDGIVSIEAEVFTDNVTIGEHQWTFITEPPGFSGTGAMQVLPEKGTFYYYKYSEKSSRLDYAVNFVKAGTHYVWIRAYSKNDQDNIFHIGLNGQEIDGAEKIGNFQDKDQWEWLNKAATPTAELRTIEVQALGVQSVNLWFGKDGAIADKIVLTTNPNYVPTGLGPDMTTDISSTRQETPSSFKLNQNYPNPFNPGTTICYSLPLADHVSLTIFDVLGRKVTTLVDGYQIAGQHSITWNLARSGMNNLTNGVYYAMFKTKSFSKSIKLLYLK